jgi:hypothetical protein
MILKRQYWKFYDFLLSSLQFGRISDKLNPVSGLIPDIKKAGLSGRISGASLQFTGTENTLLKS